MGYYYYYRSLHLRALFDNSTDCDSRRVCHLEEKIEEKREKKKKRRKEKKSKESDKQIVL